jgi:hypothetical protein
MVSSLASSEVDIGGVMVSSLATSEVDSWIPKTITFSKGWFARVTFNEMIMTALYLIN